MLHTAPLFHIGAISGFVAAMLRQSSHVFIAAFEPLSVMQTIAANRVTDTFFVPTMLHALLDHPEFPNHDLSCLERISYGASPMPSSLLDEAFVALPRVSFIQAYGMTELSPVATLLMPEDHKPAARVSGHAYSAGRATMTTEVRIVDTDGCEVPRGIAGEIAVRGEGVMAGYWGMPEVTRDAVRNGWMHTGDIGRMDEAGYVYVLDRLKDMIITGGENVYSAEVESALGSHPAVARCAVIGVPDPRWGEAVHAVVVLRPDVTAVEAELIAHCRAQIANYKSPRGFTFVAALPLSGAGKVLKTELRAALRDKRT